MIYRLYEDKASYPKPNAQANLMGRTHYVDDDTLRFFRAKIISARPICGGLLFAIIESTSIDYNRTKRGFRGVVFDLIGNPVYRPNLDGCFRTSEKARKAMWEAINGMDERAINTAAIKSHREWMNREFDDLQAKVVGASKVEA